MKGSILFVWAVLAVAGSACAFSQDSCSVIQFGARGDCNSDDTAAFQKAADACGSFVVPRPAGQCYRVDGVKLRSGSTVTLEDRNTEVRPLTPQTRYVFDIEGTARARSAFVTIRNGILWAPFQMSEGTAGVKIDQANHIKIEDTVINGFYDDVFADNTAYLYLLHVSANGASHANVWHQDTDTHDGSYFGGPLYIDHSTMDSCQCWAASVWVQDVAVVNVTDSDIVGVSEGQGFHADSSNGFRGTTPDYPAGIHIHGTTFDSIAGEPIYVANYIKSDLQGSWVSGGREKMTPCIWIGAHVRDFSVSDTHVFWCGTDALRIDRAYGVKVSNSTFSATPQVGIHNVYGIHSFFYGNTCDATTYNGFGSSVQLFCVYEEPAAQNNTYLGNDGSGTRYGNSFHGAGRKSLLE